MWNRVISYSLVFLKVPVIIIMRFGENIVLGPKYINIYKFRVGWTWSTVHFLFIFQKNRKSTRAWPILKSNSTSFWFIFFPWMSIVVLVDFIAILLTPGIFLIQIVNINNTNIYLIHFHSKNIIKMGSLRKFYLKFQSHCRHSLSIATRWNKLRWHQQRLQNRLLLLY